MVQVKLAHSLSENLWNLLSLHEVSGNIPIPSEYVEAFDHVTWQKQPGLFYYPCQNIVSGQNKMADCVARGSEGTKIEFLFKEDVDDESLLMSLDVIECFSSSDEFEEVKNELDAVWNDVSF